jgi:hypothetical protein
VHVANGVARITLGATTGQQDQKATPCGTLIIPVMQLPVFARVLSEVTRQVEQRAKDAMAQAQAKSQADAGAPAGDAATGGAFRFNG